MVLEGVEGRFLGVGRHGHPHDPPARHGRDQPPFRPANGQPAARAALHLFPQSGRDAAPAALPAAWKLRFVASLPARSFIYVISNRFAWPVAKAIGFGIADGLMNRLGAPGRWRAPVRMRRRGAAQAG